jgi:GAF domain-containing protein
MLNAKQLAAIQANAFTMREDALEARLRLWQSRLLQLRNGGPRDSVLEHALDAALSVTSADCANIQVVPPNGRGLVLVAQRGFSQPFLDFFEYVNDARSACGLALKEHRSIAVADVVCSPVFVQTPALPVLLDAGIRAVTSTPLVSRQNRTVGMLSVHYRKPRTRLYSDLARFQDLARAIADLMA